jgi:starvation-inducible DNA-binding protein
MSKTSNSDMAAMHSAAVPSAHYIMLAAAPNPIPDRDDRYPTSIHIEAAARSELRELLNQHLVDTLDLFSQTQQAHWNATGRYFHQFHKLFDRLAEELEDHAGIIAQRIATLGGVARGTVRTAAADSRLPELPLDLGDGGCTVRLLEERYAQLGQTTRKAIDEHSGWATLTRRICLPVFHTIWIRHAGSSKRICGLSAADRRRPQAGLGVCVVEQPQFDRRRHCRSCLDVLMWLRDAQPGEYAERPMRLKLRQPEWRSPLRYPD